MIPKSGNRFSDEIMLKGAHDPQYLEIMRKRPHEPVAANIP